MFNHILIFSCKFRFLSCTYWFFNFSCWQFRQRQNLAAFIFCISRKTNLIPALPKYQQEFGEMWLMWHGLETVSVTHKTCFSYSDKDFMYKFYNWNTFLHDHWLKLRIMNLQVNRYLLAQISLAVFHDSLYKLQLHDMTILILLKQPTVYTYVYKNQPNTVLQPCTLYWSKVYWCHTVSI